MRGRRPWQVSLEGGACAWLEGRDNNDDDVQRIIISLGERGEKNGG
jgi:hypothetical protein